MKKLSGALAIVILATRLLAQSNAPVRLALIAETDEASAASDVLTAQLSGNPQIQLLERNEIEKVYREQGLSAANRDYLKLGRILGADGLLIMQLSKETGPQRLSVRLVAVKPGVTLRQREYPWPLDNQLEWAGVVVSQFQPVFVKLAVLPKDAVPISILNLRSAVASVQGETAERELTQLLYARLVNERDIFVLERRRMDLLAEEKELNAASASAFWNGSYLLEGTIDKEGYNKDTVNIGVRLTPPDKKEFVLVEVSGARTNLIGVVNDLAARILVALKKTNKSTEWNPQAEADRYFSEAQWMFRWGMFQEAKSAGEAAWALGKQTSEVAQLKIKTCEASAGSPGDCVVRNETKRVVFGQPINLNVNDFRQIAAFESAPGAERFADIVRAEELFPDTFRSFAALDQKLDPAWLNLGNETLDRASLWLRYYYFTAEARSGQEARIEEAKRLCLEIAGMLESHPDFANTDTNHTLLTMKARHSAFWVDTPEQGRTIYRALIETGQWPLVRQRFFNAAYVEVNLQRENQGFTRTMVSDGMGRFDPNDAQAHWANLANPCLTGWKWADRLRCPAVWNGFIDELCGSFKPLTGLEGRILRCSYSWSEADFEQNLTRLLDYVRQQHDTIAAAGLDKVLLDDLRILVNQRADALTKECRGRVQDQAWATFEREFEASIKQHEQARNELKEGQARLAKLEEKKNYLNSQANFDFMSFAQILLNDDYRPEEAKELLPLVTNYEARINSNKPIDNGDHITFIRHQAGQKQAGHWISVLEEKLSGVISPPSPKANVPHSPVAAKPASPTPKVAMPGDGSVPAKTNSSVALSAANMLSISRFWMIPTPSEIQTTDWGDGNYTYFYFGDYYSPQIIACRYRDGKLWVEVRYDQAGSKGRADFFSVDLKTFESDKISFVGEDFSLTGAFEVYNGYLYLSLGKSIRRYSFKDNAWEQFEVPAAGSTPVRLGNRLFFTSASSILEYTPDGSFRTLASSRRRPAATLLDDIENCGSSHLFLTTDGTLHACVQKDVYAFSDSTNGWYHVATFPGIYFSKFYPADDGFMAGTGPSGEAWWGMSGRAARPEFLFQQPSDHPVYTQYAPDKKEPLPHWRVPVPSIECWSQGDCFWFLTGSPGLFAAASDHRQIQEGIGPSMSLVRFRYDENKPLTIPIRFVTDGMALTPAATASPRPISVPLAQPWSPQWRFEWTPQGLVMFRNLALGFWLIPASDLDAAVGHVYSEQHSQQEALDALHENWRKELLAAHDRNHNGAFESEERETMIDDPHYLELELPVIDANTNGLLDAGELRFFDANINGVLEPREQNAVETTLSLLAEKLVAKLTPDAEGRIDPDDLPKELLNASGSRAASRANFGRMNPNGREKIGKTDIETMMRSYLIRGLRIGGKPAIPVVLSGEPTDPKTLFKARVEEYWKSSKPPTNLPGSPTPAKP